MSKATLNRLPVYLRYLYKINKLNIEHVSSTIIAEGLNLNPVQVRKDIALVSSVAGKPKTGFITKELIIDLESFLGYDNENNAVIVGVGGLGKAFMGYSGFENYGLNIIAGFEKDNQMIGNTIKDKPILPFSDLARVIKENDIQIGIIAVPSASAQEVADIMIKAGIKGIWNFANCHLSAPNNVVIKSEDLAANLALLSIQVKTLTN